MIAIRDDPCKDRQRVRFLHGQRGTVLRHRSAGQTETEEGCIALVSFGRIVFPADDKFIRREIQLVFGIDHCGLAVQVGAARKGHGKSEIQFACRRVEGEQHIVAFKGRNGVIFQNPVLGLKMSRDSAGHHVQKTNIVMYGLFRSGKIQAEGFVDVRRADGIDDVRIHIHQFVIAHFALGSVDDGIGGIRIARKYCVADPVDLTGKIRRKRSVVPVGFIAHFLSHDDLFTERAACHIDPMRAVAGVQIVGRVLSGGDTGDTAVGHQLFTKFQRKERIFILQFFQFHNDPPGCEGLTALHSTLLLVLL